MSASHKINRQPSSGREHAHKQGQSGTASSRRETKGVIRQARATRFQSPGQMRKVRDGMNGLMWKTEPKSLDKRTQWYRADPMQDAVAQVSVYIRRCPLHNGILLSYLK